MVGSIAVKVFGEIGDDKSVDGDGQRLLFSRGGRCHKTHVSISLPENHGDRVGLPRTEQNPDFISSKLDPAISGMLTRGFRYKSWQFSVLYLICLQDRVRGVAYRFG